MLRIGGLMLRQVWGLWDI